LDQLDLTNQLDGSQMNTGTPWEEPMSDYLKNMPQYVQPIQSMMDLILTNIVLLGQVPAPTFFENDRVTLFLERLAEFSVDECTTDGYNNPIGIIHGASPSPPPIFVVAHMDTAFGKEVDHHFTLGQNSISGAGLSDNSLGVGVLASLPQVLQHLGLKFNSDIVLAGVIQSIGRGNLRGIRHLLKTWPTPIRGAVCLEGGELGRLNYYSDGMIRCEIICHVDPTVQRSPRATPNAILVLNEVIHQILNLRIPLEPRAKVIFGKINGGVKHGQIALNATLGLEIRSDADGMVRHLYTHIRDIVQGVAHAHDVELKTKTISNVRAARLKHNHPLVDSAAAIMESLDLHPIRGSSESELSIFLSCNVPAITLGITQSQGDPQNETTMAIDPIFKGIAQVIGTLLAIDGGVCDE
jgi:tripeptide aminopeptidase